VFLTFTFCEVDWLLPLEVLMLCTMCLKFHHQHHSQLKVHAQRSKYHCVVMISKCRAVLMLMAALNSSVVSAVI